MPALTGRLGAVGMDGELPRKKDLGLVFDELDYQMACQTYLWALPLVSYAQWREQHREVFDATDYDLVHYVSYQDRLGLITANAITPYTLAFVDLGRTGPLVIELPEGLLTGGVSDFWQREIVTMGEMGPDRCRGGRYLVVPPGGAEPKADGYHVVHSPTVNIMFGFRSLSPDLAKARALVDAVKLYSYEGRKGATRVLTPDGRAWSGDQPRGMAYWERLHEIYQNEVVDERDRFYLAMLKQLGIEKGKPFAPGARLTWLLEEGAAAGELMARANTFAKRFEGSRYWPDRRWDLAIMLDEPSQRAEHHDQLLERVSWFYEAVNFSAAMKSQTPGRGQAYLSAYVDADDEWLDGGAAYALTIPADPPAKHFWSIAVYDAGTRCLVDNHQGRGDRNSRDTGLAPNPDGSVTLYFGPTEPEEGAANWIQTVRGRHWFSHFSLYGPLESYHDRSWKLGDITPR